MCSEVQAIAAEQAISAAPESLLRDEDKNDSCVFSLPLTVSCCDSAECAPMAFLAMVGAGTLRQARMPLCQRTDALLHLHATRRPLRKGLCCACRAKVRFERIIRDAQDSICNAVTEMDGKPFHEDAWTRAGVLWALSHQYQCQRVCIYNSALRTCCTCSGHSGHDNSPLLLCGALVYAAQRHANDTANACKSAVPAYTLLATPRYQPCCPCMQTAAVA